MKFLIFLVVVGVTTAATVPPQEPFGKELEECKNRNSMTNTHNVRHETNCHQFYKCLGGYGFVIDCPTLKGVKLVFNEKVSVCDWEGVPCSDEDNNVTSSTPSTPSTPSTSTKPTPGVPVKPPNCAIAGDRKQPHEDCHKFYYCQNGKALVGNCPEGTHFNNEIAECDLGECKN